MPDLGASCQNYPKRGVRIDAPTEADCKNRLEEVIDYLTKCETIRGVSLLLMPPIGLAESIHHSYELAAFNKGYSDYSVVRNAVIHNNLVQMLFTPSTVEAALEAVSCPGAPRQTAPDN